MENFKMGLVSVSFRNNSPTEILSEMKDAKINNIEWGSDVHAPCKDLQRLSEIAYLQKQYGITCCSYGTYFRIGVNSIEEIYDYISAAKVLGTNVLRLWCGSKNSEEYTLEEEKILFNECKALAQIGADCGVVFCLECHIGTFTNSLNSALEVMQYVNSNNFKMYWQPHQNRTTDINLNYAKNIAPYTVNIHAFNWDGSFRYPLSDAKELWIKYLNYFDGSQFVLLEFMPDDNINTLSTEADSLRKIVEALQ